MGLVVVPVVQLFTGREHYTLPDRPRLLKHFMYTLPRPFRAKRYFVCLVLGPLRAASRNRGTRVLEQPKLSRKQGVPPVQCLFRRIHQWQKHLLAKRTQGLPKQRTQELPKQCTQGLPKQRTQYTTLATYPG